MAKTAKHSASSAGNRWSELYEKYLPQPLQPIFLGVVWCTLMGSIFAISYHVVFVIGNTNGSADYYMFFLHKIQNDLVNFRIVNTQEQQDCLKILLRLCAISVLFVFIAGELTRNFSQVDRLWSTLPVLYVWLVT